jgi:hypothetical protein
MQLHLNEYREDVHTTKTNDGPKMHLKDIFISSSFETWLSTDVGIQLYLNEYWKDVHTTKTDGGSKLHLKDNLILSSFETWLSTYVITQLHWMNVGKGTNHEDWLWDNLFWS